MNARYVHGPTRGGGKCVDSGFQSLSVKQLSATLERLTRNGGHITILERGMVLHVYFEHGLASIEYYPSSEGGLGFVGPIFKDQLPHLFTVIESGVEPTAFIEALPRVHQAAAT